MANREPTITDDACPPCVGSLSPLPVAIVVPTLNEAEGIVAVLRQLRRGFPDCELVVVDGGSSDATAALAAGHARVLHSSAGRAVQMNAGASATSAPVLWFVHADCRIDPVALGQIRAALADPGVVGGGLSLRFDRRSIGLDYLAWSSTKRARHLHQVFGDQAMFVRRDAFESLGGFPEIAIMEDLELSRRLARHGRLVVLPATSTASSRRLVDHGTWSMIVFMQSLKACYFLGVAPEKIRRLYRAGPPWKRPSKRTRRRQRRQRPTRPAVSGWRDPGVAAPRPQIEPTRPEPAEADRAPVHTEAQ
ncbi:MAG: TIGR04283 family arsenosugar biosynthesis glycosyltransferase [Acidimicrobiales bacterium]